MSADVILLVAHRFLRDSVGGTKVLVDDTTRAVAVRGRYVILMAVGPDGSAGMNCRRRHDGVEEWHILPDDASRFPEDWDPIEARLTDRIAMFLNRYLGTRRITAVHAFHLARIGLAFLDLPLRRTARRVATLTEYTAICYDLKVRNRRTGTFCHGDVGAGTCADCLAAAGVPRIEQGDIATWRARNRRVLAGFHWMFVHPSQRRKFLEANGFDEAPLVQDVAAYRMPDSWSSRRWGVDDTQPTPIRFFYVGHTYEEKGLDVAPAAFVRFRTNYAEAELIVAGPLPEVVAPSIQQGAPRSGVYFTGTVPFTEHGPQIAACDCILISSLWQENHPIVLTYVFSLGLSALFSDLASLRHLSDSGSIGFVADGHVPSSVGAKRQVAELQIASRPNCEVRLPLFDRLVDRIEDAIEGSAA